MNNLSKERYAFSAGINKLITICQSKMKNMRKYERDISDLIMLNIVIFSQKMDMEIVCKKILSYFVSSL